ncbi:hypothetical protein Hanom_Chr07g00605431 [Helianthus anomalus]
MLREKLKEQRKKNKELHGFVSEQSKFLRFQHKGMIKMHEMLQRRKRGSNLELKYLGEDLFNFDNFKEKEEKSRAAEATKKKKRLESVVDVKEEGDNEEEEVDRYEIPTMFVEWGLEDEVIYETDGGEEVAPQHPKWFKKEREKFPDFYQDITIEKTKVTDKIIR